MEAMMQFMNSDWPTLRLGGTHFHSLKPPRFRPASCIQNSEKREREREAPGSNHGSEVSAWHSPEVSHTKLHWAQVRVGFGGRGGGCRQWWFAERTFSLSLSLSLSLSPVLSSTPSSIDPCMHRAEGIPPPPLFLAPFVSMLPSASPSLALSYPVSGFLIKKKTNIILVLAFNQSTGLHLNPT